jgi:hypothetical protein
MSARAVWPLVARPVDCHRIAEALLGLTPAAARLAGGVILVTSPEADRLVDAMPGIVRSLSVATAARNERWHGEVRGPVVWGETVAARAATAGDIGLFVCASPRRAYDTAENRVLVAALRAIRDAARLVDRQGLRRRDSDLARHVRHNAGLATRWLDHRALAGISRPPDRRDRARTRAGKRAATYRPALELLEVAAAPIGPDHIDALADARARAQHAVVAELVAALRRRGYPEGALAAQRGILRGRWVRYVHDGAASRAPLPPGIHAGDLLLDVAVTPDGRTLPGPEALDRLRERAGGRPCAVVAGPADIDWALTESGLFPPR